MTTEQHYSPFEAETSLTLRRGDESILAYRYSHLNAEETLKLGALSSQARYRVIAVDNMKENGNLTAGQSSDKIIEHVK